MSKKAIKTKKSPKSEIKKVCEEVVLVSEIEGHLARMDIELMNAKQQVIVWQTKAAQIEGAIAGYNTILETKKTPHTLVMTDNHSNKEKKDESGSHR